MRFLSVAVALVMLFSVGAMAQESGAFDVSGGVYLGNHTYSDSDELKSNALGFYASADASIPGLPVAITGSFATFSPDKSEKDKSDAYFEEQTVTLFDLLVGYRVFGDLAVGAGWASYGWKGTHVDGPEKGKFDLSNGGFAIGAFGKLPLSDGFQASGKLLFVPSSKLKDKGSDNDGSDTKDTNMFGFTVSATYAVNDNFGIEGGYRSLRIKSTKKGTDTEITTGGFFLGVSYAF